jgi:hypothetical protein
MDSHFSDCGAPPRPHAVHGLPGATYPLIGMVLDDAWATPSMGSNRRRELRIYHPGRPSSDVDNLYLDGNCAEVLK